MELDNFLSKLEKELPEVLTDKDLYTYIKCFFKNPVTLTRMRAQGICPPFFSISPHIYYLRNEVINWIKERYVYPKKGKKTS